jgi:uncharacterized membrane protein YgdD (TMEM256/DUF423 family)
MSARWAGILGAVLAGLAVAAGAFGTHALRGILPPERVEVFETAARYQFYHALGLLTVAWLAERRPSRALAWAGWGFLLGMVLFCSSLYLLALTGLRWLGALAPLGGLSFLAGWGALGWAFAHRPASASHANERAGGQAGPGLAG